MTGACDFELMRACGCAVMQSVAPGVYLNTKISSSTMAVWEQAMGSKDRAFDLTAL